MFGESNNIYNRVPLWTLWFYPRDGNMPKAMLLLFVCHSEYDADSCFKYRLPLFFPGMCVNIMKKMGLGECHQFTIKATFFFL